MKEGESGREGKSKKALNSVTHNLTGVLGGFVLFFNNNNNYYFILLNCTFKCIF